MQKKETYRHFSQKLSNEWTFCAINPIPKSKKKIDGKLGTNMYCSDSIVSLYLGIQLKWNVPINIPLQNGGFI